ncbi:fimbrial protein [Enterobacter cloacae]|uniref:fimbrial protein n=1 Tax=Enterobacter cloacae TaxID=550 RepID=UPI00188B1A06|nr:fimbrial protein [Enterobacter cloacae]MBF4114161.1 fimbrial protein [Enterobacter cloacae]
MKRFYLPLIGNGNTKFLSLLLYLSVLFLSSRANAVATCVDCGTVTNTINANLASSENYIGNQKASSDILSSAGLYNATPGQQVQWWVTYPGESVIPSDSATVDWSYRRVDDYISVALSVEHPECNRQFYAPFNVQLLNNSTCTASATPGDGKNMNFTPVAFRSRIKITKKIVGGTYSRNIFVAESGICQPNNCASKQAIISRVYLNLSITAPETCELNSGQVINIDFGNISSGAFKTAGAIAQGVQPRSRDISVKCDNIAGNAQLTMRLQADKTNGNIVVSDENNDVGFRVTNNSGTPLIPNNLSSVIPFTLDSNARQNVTIQAYPVSVTGNKPTEGAVTSRAYLRVDFP